MKKPNKMKICSKCGKRISFNETCKCSNRNEYQKKYIQDNSEAYKPLRTVRWQKFRIHIINRDGGLCQRCLIKYNIFTYDDLEVHHIKPRIKYPELIFNEENCITLCSTCNLQLGIAEELDFEPRFDIKQDDYFNL
jgi:5-methylcytosine-specific restriction endonuclease McrA